ncbi:MAG: hypothetical protein M0Z60_01430 [Nitrospiraceae bacterium]|nr:hypothetical protein [Nitrospiraceae bacterium]
MAQRTPHNAIRCPTLEFSGTAISELEGDKTVFTVPRDQIRRLTLLYESEVKNPFCRYFMGFVLFFLGLVGLIAVMLASAIGHPLLQPETGSSELAPLLLLLWLLIGVGIWLLSAIFSARYRLLIDASGGQHKVSFAKAMTLLEIRQFIKRAQMFFGYEIDVSVLDKAGVSSMLGDD